MPHFFFSYSRGDAADTFIYQFYEDLRREVSIRGNIPHDSAGFLDKNQPVGADWNTSTSRALGTSKVFVPVYSPKYFGDSPYCGQEWHAFRSRLPTTQAVTGNTLGSIVPVWWVPPRGDLPPAVSPIQDTRDQFGPEYREFGLRYLMQLKEEDGKHGKYWDFIVKFAVMLLAAGENPPEEKTDVDLLSEPNAFEDGAGPTIANRYRGVAADNVSSIKHVTFVVAAGSRDEMRPIRGDAEIYGEEAHDWRPYHPSCPERIAKRAQHVALDLDMLSDPRPVDGDLLDLIRDCQRRRRLLVLILDPWLLGLENYNRMLARLDTILSGNAAIVVPWETAEPTDGSVRDTLLVCLSNWMDAGARYFREDVHSMEDFERNLRDVLLDVSSRILRKAEAARRVDEPGPTSLAILSGPGR